MFGGNALATTTYGGKINVKQATIKAVGAIAISAIINTPTIHAYELNTNLSISSSVINPTTSVVNRSIKVVINSIDVTNQIDFRTLTISNNLFSSPDIATLEVIKGKSYSPAVGDEIEIYDTGTKVFGGILLRKSETTDGYLGKYKIEFKDWTEELGNILVDKSYSNQTVEDIISDIFTDTNLTEYDGITHVSDTTTINHITFDNISVVSALDKLAEVSDKNWYVDPSKNIYFFADSGVQAPFDLDDTNGNYEFNSLELTEDLSQIRNKVIVKGKGLSPITVEDATSQTNYGLREYIKRSDVESVSEATQQANAILAAYKDPIKKAKFRTRKIGLFAGQEIDIISTIRGISETMNIEEVSFIAVHPKKFYYEVSASTKKLNGLNELFKNQLDDDKDTPISDQEKIQNIEFTAIDYETIQWSSGTITTSNGDSFTINAKASQTLTGDHIIYFDSSVSTNELQISDNFADGIGNGKIPICYALKNAVTTKGADIIPVSFGGKIQLDGSVHITERSIVADNIAANSITANEIAANTITANEIAAGSITADRLSVSQLSAISANIGSITAGSITGVTITGATVQTAATGYRAVMTSSNGFQLYNGTSWQGTIKTDSAASMILQSAGNIYLFKGANQMAFFTGNSLDFPSGYEMTWASGRKMTDVGYGWEFDGDLVPSSDEGNNCGTASKKWNEVRGNTIWQSSNTDGSRHCYDFAYVEMGLLPKKVMSKRLKGIDGMQLANGYVPGLELPYKQGTVLKWSKKGLKEATKENDFVIAVANEKGLPIVLGAEPVRVIGKAKIGDWIVASNQKGCAKATKTKKRFVIGKCLENKTTEKEKLIKVMINI